MSAISMRILGVNNAISYINKNKLGVKKGITESMIKAGEELKKEVKASIKGQKNEPRSVDTGYFLNSITVATGTSNDTVSIFTDAKYAKFLEYGTIHIEPRQHFKNSMNRKRNDTINIVKDKIK